MSMEIMLRYIVGIAIAYGIGKWIYQSIRSRSIDFFLLAIIALMGAVLWLSRGFLISNRVYDFLMIVVWLVAVGCFIISRKSQYGKYLKFAAVGGLSTFLVLFVYWNVKAESIKPTTLTTQLRGDLTSRIVEVCFRYKDIQKALTKKLKNLLYVTAQTKKEGGKELFYFNKADIYTEPSFERFISLLTDGKIMYDIRIGSYKSGPKYGMPHDHGSGFRILEANIRLLYSDHETIE